MVRASSSLDHRKENDRILDESLVRKNEKFSAKVPVNIDLFAEQCMDLGQRYIGGNKDGAVQIFLLRRTPSLISRHLVILKLLVSAECSLGEFRNLKVIVKGVTMGRAHAENG
jgi:hypothetical protein